MAAAVNSDRGTRALSVVGNERTIGENAQDLHKMWESVGRLVPEKAALGDRVLFRLAKAFFHDNMVLRSVDLSQMNGEVCAGRFYEAVDLTLYSEDGLYRQPESDGLRPT